MNLFITNDICNFQNKKQRENDGLEVNALDLEL